MIAFSLNKELDPQEIISSISRLIKKEVKSPEECLLVISISKVSQVIEGPEIKCIEV